VGPCPAKSATSLIEKIPHRSDGQIWRRTAERPRKCLHQKHAEAWGAEHTSRLDTVNILGKLYKNQGKMAEAEAMYVRVLQGYDTPHCRYRRGT
jgi:hypothetical protein